MWSFEKEKKKHLEFFSDDEKSITRNEKKKKKKKRTMTHVDRPGHAKHPVGDQPPDVERRVRELALRYVSAPTCLILAVTPAGADAVTSDALHLAREADPRGERTLGVLTKCDLADFGGGRSSGAAATVAPLLRGEVLPLRLGYVAVVCRGGRAAASGLSAADGRAA